MGSSTDGEGNRHELAHVVLALLLGRTPRLVYEGLATWTGGSAGLGFRALLPGLRRYVREQPTITLHSIMTNPPVREGTFDVGYDGFAVLCERSTGREASRPSGNWGTPALHHRTCWTRRPDCLAFRAPAWTKRGGSGS